MAFKRLCPLCSRVRYEDIIEVCRECASEHTRLHKLYMNILTTRPHLRRLTMPEVFEKLWAAYLRDAGNARAQDRSLR